MKFRVGGELQEGDQSYVLRKADKRVLQAIRTKNYCYILDSSQMGKSSLRNNLRKQLEEDWVTAIIDLQEIGTDCEVDQFYNSIIYHLAEKLDICTGEVNKTLTPVKRLKEFVSILLKRTNKKILVIIDEIGLLHNSKLANDFLFFIRFCYSNRAREQEYNRLTFILLGIASPNELIKDDTKSPFNIGTRIELQGFTTEEVYNSQLIEGLKTNSEKPTFLIMRILDWTGGQPFLTQKLCKLVVETDDWIPPGSETEYIDKLVQERVLENWKNQDNPQHLRTIENCILGSSEPEKLLDIYEKILTYKKIPRDNSFEQIELRLSGLLTTNQEGELTVFNPIYKKVFSREWIQEKRENLRPYLTKIRAWEKAKDENKEIFLLEGNDLKIALNWVKKHYYIDSLDLEGIQSSDLECLDIDKRFLSDSIKYEKKQKRKEQLNILWKGVFVGLAGGLAIMSLGSNFGNLIKNSKLEYCSLLSKIKNECLKITSGDRLFISSSRNPYLEKGIKAFKKHEYNSAKKIFAEAIITAPKDPVAEIYYNNALARSEGAPYKLAAVVPANSNEELAEIMLRGIANAQAEFNTKGRHKGRFLEIVLVNDGDDPNKSSQDIAQKIASEQDILGVIGHYSSEASAAVLPFYDKAKLAMISPTSAGSYIDELRKNSNNKVFFRTVPNNTKIVPFIEELRNKYDKVAVYYDHESEAFSKNSCEVFVKEFRRRDGKVDTNGDGRFDRLDDKQKECEDKNIRLGSDVQVDQIIEQEQVQAIMVIPSSRSRFTVINMAKKLKEKLKDSKETQNKDIPIYSILGVLYNPDFIEEGGVTVQDIYLNVVKISDKSDYYSCAKFRWEQEDQLNYRTITAYDATKALIKSLEKASSPTREEILNELRNIDISAEEASGLPIKFDDNGNIIGREFDTLTIKELKDKNSPIPTRKICSQNRRNAYDSYQKAQEARGEK